MFKHVASLATLVSLASPALALGVAGCAAPSGSEEVGSSNEAVASEVLTNLFILPSDSTMSFAFTVPGAALTVSISGPTGAATQTATLYPSATRNQAATFTGLEPCATYTWSVNAPDGVVASGQTNTRLSGITGLCQASEAVSPSAVYVFHGMEHQESNNAWCDSGNWNPVYENWPIGEGWRAFGLTNSPPGSVEFGFYNWTNGASGPFPCAESIVEARRGELQFALTPSQYQRATNATMTASFVSEYGGAPCVGSVAKLQAGPGVQWAQESSGGLWAGLLGGAETSETMVSYPSGVPTFPVAWSGNQLSVNFGKPTTTTVYAGFEANDGFANGADPVHYGYAVQNAGCMSTASNAVLNLTYSAMAPETPVGCTGTISCGNTTVTCGAAPETFELHRSYPGYGGYTLAASVGPGAAMAGPVLVDPSGSSSYSYSVCTVNTAGAQTCGPINWTSVTACPPPPPPVTGGGGGSGGSCPNVYCGGKPHPLPQ